MLKFQERDRVRESVARSSNGATFFFSLGMALLYRFVTEMMHHERLCLRACRLAIKCKPYRVDFGRVFGREDGPPKKKP